MNKKISNDISKYFAEIYYSLHYQHDEVITHQAVRILQYIYMNEEVTIGDIASFLNISHNTASEHVKRLIKSDLVKKERSSQDERRVLVQLTEKGEKTLIKNTRLDEEKLSAVLENLNEEDKKIIHNAFSLLAQEARKCML